MAKGNSTVAPKKRGTKKSTVAAPDAQQMEMIEVPSAAAEAVRALLAYLAEPDRLTKVRPEEPDEPEERPNRRDRSDLFDEISTLLTDGYALCTLLCCSDEMQSHERQVFWMLERWFRQLEQDFEAYSKLCEGKAPGAPQG